MFPRIGKKKKGGTRCVQGDNFQENRVCFFQNLPESARDPPHKCANVACPTAWMVHPVDPVWISGESLNTGSTQIFLRSGDGSNVSSDFQVAPKKTGLQRSITTVGQVCVTKATSSYFGAPVKRSPTKFLAERLGQVEPRFFMAFEQDSAGADEALPTKPGNVPAPLCES